MPKCVVAISGKRKSGKDYCTKILKQALENRQVAVAVTGISNSLKMEFAKIHGLDYAELLTDGPYKEKYRREMIKAAINPFISTDVVIVSDCRRPSDYRFFTENYSTLTVRVETSDEHRHERGFKFVDGVDDADSECALDLHNFDAVLRNLTGEDLTPQVERIMDIVFEILDKEKKKNIVNK
uniref:Phosphomevalonate kinase n=1 Tax=Caenorhabditis japonica TaxID=281687 RepID=A0A8R1HV19_CAEJA